MKTPVATRIKICGITRLPDAEAVAQAGADALGLNFADQSPRQVPLQAATRIAREIDGALCRVGLFVDPDSDRVRRVLDLVELDLLQFHGQETDAFCSGFGLPYMKAHRIRDAVDADALARAFPGASWHLLDAYVPGQAGGTGHRFDWGLWPRGAGLNLALAGGLTPENVGEAVRTLKPQGVDVAGGVEGAVKGEKEPERIRAFVAAVRAAEQGSD